MLTGSVFVYGLIASFILGSLQRNQRAQRAHGQTLAVAGWGLMSASFAMAIMLLLLAAEMATR